MAACFFQHLPASVMFCPPHASPCLLAAQPYNMGLWAIDMLTDSDRLTNDNLNILWQ